MTDRRLVPADRPWAKVVGYSRAVRVGDVVWVGVRDSSRRQPRVLFASPDDISGRGLTLVSALATRWGIDWRDGQKVVWAEIPLEDASRMAACC